MLLTNSHIHLVEAPHGFRVSFYSFYALHLEAFSHYPASVVGGSIGALGHCLFNQPRLIGHTQVSTVACCNSLVRTLLQKLVIQDHQQTSSTSTISQPRRVPRLLRTSFQNRNILCETVSLYQAHQTSYNLLFTVFPDLGSSARISKRFLDSW